MACPTGCTGSGCTANANSCPSGTTKFIGSRLKYFVRPKSGAPSGTNYSIDYNKVRGANPLQTIATKTGVETNCCCNYNYVIKYEDKGSTKYLARVYYTCPGSTVKEHSNPGCTLGIYEMGSITIPGTLALNIGEKKSLSVTCKDTGGTTRTNPEISPMAPPCAVPPDGQTDNYALKVCKSNNNVTISVTNGVVEVAGNASGNCSITAYFKYKNSVGTWVNRTSNVCTVTVSTVVSTGTIAGKVTDSVSGAGLSGVKVSDGTPARDVTTNASGNYTISNVPPGTYTVTASKSGYVTQSKPGQIVTAGNTKTVNFSLVASPTGTITVGNPNGTDWIRGKPYSITWTYANITGTVKIQLYKISNGTYSNIATNVSIANKKYTWNIPSNQSTENYRVKVTSESNANIYDFSVTFKIVGRYSCDVNTNKCISDPNGTYTTPNCDGKCEAATTTSNKNLIYIVAGVGLLGLLILSSKGKKGGGGQRISSGSDFTS